MILIAQLGGYLNRKCDRVPGFESIWKGYARFHDMAEIIQRQRMANQSSDP